MGSGARGRGPRLRKASSASVRHTSPLPWVHPSQVLEERASATERWRNPRSPLEHRDLASATCSLLSGARQTPGAPLTGFMKHSPICDRTLPARCRQSPVSAWLPGCRAPWAAAAAPRTRERSPERPTVCSLISSGYVGRCSSSCGNQLPRTTKRLGWASA